MNIKPILFNIDMVHAILAGHKTATRRVVKPQPLSKLAYRCMGYKHGTWAYPDKDAWKYWGDEGFRLPDNLPDKEKRRRWTPPCHTDDILYVRETWAAWSRTDGIPPALYYKADADTPNGIKWHPSIHMPREVARIFLRVTDVWVERLQAITEKQARAEGCCTYADIVSGPISKDIHAFDLTAIDAFETVWESTIKPADRALYGWDANPYVWVIEFERCEKPEEGS